MKKLVVVVLAILAAAACGGAETASNSSGGVDRTGGAPQSANLSTGGAVTKPGATGTTAGGTTTSPTDTVPALAGPPVIRQAQLSLTVGAGTFDNKLSEIRTLVEAEGGYIAGTDAQANPAVDDSRIRSAVVSFMVPANKFDTTIDQLSKVGTVQSERISGTDVSAQYVDLNARLANAEAQRNAMLALLKQATNINDIIAVQNQIGQITAQIEQLKGQIKYLDDNTSYSSISLTIAESGAPVQTPSTDSWGFATALNQGAHNFMTTINYLVAGLGAAGPFLVLLLLGYIVWRRRGSPMPRRA